MKCYFLVNLIIHCLLIRCAIFSPIVSEPNITSGDDSIDYQTEEDNSGKTSLARLLQENSEFIGQDLLRSILGSRVFNRADVSQTEKTLTEMTANIQKDDRWENEVEIEELSPVKINDESKYMSGTIRQVDEIAGDSADYFDKNPKLSCRNKTSKKPDTSNKKEKSKPSKIHSGSKVCHEKKIDSNSSDNEHLVMVLDATNSSSRLDPLYVVFKSKDGNLTNELKNRIHITRTKLFDLINKIDSHRNTTLEKPSTVTDKIKIGETLQITETLPTTAKFETNTQKCLEKQRTTMKSHNASVTLKGLSKKQSQLPTMDKLKQTTPSDVKCEDEGTELIPIILKVYVPLSVQLEPILVNGMRNYVIRSISIDNSNDYKSIFGNDQYNNWIK